MKEVDKRETAREALHLTKIAGKHMVKRTLKRLLKRLTLLALFIAALLILYNFVGDFIYAQLLGQAKKAAVDTAAEAIQNYTLTDVRKVSENAAEIYLEAKQAGESAQQLFGQAQDAFVSVSPYSSDKKIPSTGVMSHVITGLKNKIGSLDEQTEKLSNKFLDALSSGDLATAAALNKALNALGNEEAALYLRVQSSAALAKAYIYKNKPDEAHALYYAMADLGAGLENTVLRTIIASAIISFHSHGEILPVLHAHIKSLPGPEFSFPKNPQSPGKVFQVTAETIRLYEDMTFIVTKAEANLLAILAYKKEANEAESTADRDALLNMQRLVSRSGLSLLESLLKNIESLPQTEKNAALEQAVQVLNKMPVTINDTEIQNDFFIAAAAIAEHYSKEENTEAIMQILLCLNSMPESEVKLKMQEKLRKNLADIIRQQEQKRE